MRTAKLGDMVGGWFVGDFEPSVLASRGACEVAVKRYKQGHHEDRHFHKIATEVTLVVSGRVQMFDQEFSDGDIIVVEPGEATDFIALTDAINVVVKLPGALNDKYLGSST